MKLIDKIKTLFIAGAILLPGCSFIQYLEPVSEIRNSKKLVEFYDVNQDGRIDRMNVSLAKPHREYVFDDIVRDAWTQYSTHDRDFNQTWEEIRYYAQDMDTKNITNCLFFDKNNNGIYEQGFLNVYIKRLEKGGQFVFKDIDEDGLFEEGVYKGVLIRNKELIWNMNYISAKLQKMIKEDLKNIKDSE